ncbi:MAG: SMP-30/gluconolactonase/LRE family protein, partial [Colwellia sp.]|nr:SMP-30/gluconolactonase/LRE family protein [Colwellia sp.]
MIIKQSKLNKLTFLTALCSSLLIASCTKNTSTQTPDTNNSSASSSTIAEANSLYCPAGSEHIQLDLTNTKLTREKDIPLMYLGYNNIEGPVWHDGALYYSNMGSHQPDKDGFELSNQTTIWRWALDSKPQIWMKDTIAGTNGLALDNKGNLIATRQLDGSLSIIDWQTKKITPIVSTFNNKRFNSPNDLTIAHDNTIYFTDPNWNTPSNINIAE